MPMPPPHYGGLTIVGTDNVAPVHDPDSLWKIWSLKDIFMGYEGTSKYVPNLNDYVVNYETNEWYIVAGVDSTTLKSDLRKLKVAPFTQEADTADKIVGIDRKCRSETYRIYLDTSVNPYTLTVDARFSVNGSMCHHVQIFRGSKLDNTAEVVSMIYDQYGELVDQNIPLELATMSGHNNHVVKCVPPCHTTVAMPDGEFVTLVVYDDVGSVVSIQEMVIENTSVIRQTDTQVKYIKDITLESPYLTDADPTLLKYPLNVPVRGLNLFGVVHYSDGSTRRLPVDGTKFQVLGLRDYVSTIVGYRADFDLRYSIGRDELAIGVKGDMNIDQSLKGDRFITKHYRGETVEPDNAYNVKLFGYPVWIDDLNGYRMEFYMTNLERSYCLYVTDHVRYNSNKSPFNGLLFGLNQRISISINLKDAHITNKDYIHTQVIDVQLQRSGGDKTGYPWSVGFEINQFPYFGIDNFAHLRIINQNLKRLYIGLDESRYESWLDRIYYRTKPLYDELREPNAPEPNMFKVITPHREFTFPITKWNQQLEINDTLKDTDNVYIEFIRRTNDTDLFLGVAALAVLPV